MLTGAWRGFYHQLELLTTGQLGLHQPISGDVTSPGGEFPASADDDLQQG